MTRRRSRLADLAYLAAFSLGACCLVAAFLIGGSIVWRAVFG